MQNETWLTLKESLHKQLVALHYSLRLGLSNHNDHNGGSKLIVMLNEVLDETLSTE